MRRLRAADLLTRFGLKAALGAGVLIRLIALLFIDNTPPFIEYSMIAKNLLAGNGYSYSWVDRAETYTLPSAFMMPLEVAIHYIGYGLFGFTGAGTIAILLLHILFAACFIIVAAKIGKELSNGSVLVGSLSAWIAALYPPFIYASLTFGIESLALLLQSAIILLSIGVLNYSTGKSSNTKAIYLLGIAAGCYYLLRGEALLYIVVLVGLLVWLGRASLTKAAFTVVKVAAITILFAAPWIIRNELVFHKPVITSTNGGLNFWRGNNSYSAGSAWDEHGALIWTTDELWFELREHLHDSTGFEPTFDSLYRSSALQWVSEHPTQAALNDGKKLLRLWMFDLNSPKGKQPLYILCYGLLLCVSIYGWIRSKPASRNSSMYSIRVLTGAWCAVVTLVVMIFFPLPRFQILLSGMMIPFAAYGIYELLKKFKIAN